MIHNRNISFEKLVQKSLCCQHNQSNYQDSLASGLKPAGLKINKPPAIKMVADFDLT